MLQFTQDDTAAHVIVTLNESITLSGPNYLFVFRHVTTKDVVAFVLTPADDQSGYPNRYNEFILNPSVLFAGKQPGEWHYQIYEQMSAVNINPAMAGGILEQGKLYLDRATDFAFSDYDLPTSFKTYNG